MSFNICGLYLPAEYVKEVCAVLLFKSFQLQRRLNNENSDRMHKNSHFSGHYYVQPASIY